MASIQAHLAVWIIKWRLKRRLKGVRDYRRARAILKPDPYKVPSSIRVTPAQLGGVSGEWVEGPKSGHTITGFPNFFMLLGPNTGLGHNSVVLMIEAQVRYAMKCLKLMKRRKQRVIEVRGESQRRFVDEIYRRMGGTVWQSGGCHSWYQDQSTGEMTTLWPGSVISYLRRTRSVSPSDYKLSS
jgi:hypothetical protein